MENEIKLRIYRGEIIDFPPIPHGPKPSHWCAIISRAYRTPETIHREPLPYNRDRHFPRLDPSPLKLHDPLEFGVEWDSPGPRPHRRDRRFFVITDLSSEHLALQSCDSALAAIEMSLNRETARRQAVKEQLLAIQSELDDALPFWISEYGDYFCKGTRKYGNNRAKADHRQIAEVLGFPSKSPES